MRTTNSPTELNYKDISRIPPNLHPILPRQK